MSDEREPSFPEVDSEPEIDEPSLRTLEGYEEALRKTPGLTPEQWLLGQVPAHLRKRLAHLSWFYQAGRSALRLPGAGPPERIGEYQILGILGRGGGGVVYRARQAGLNRVVALKVVTPSSFDSGSDFQRFRLESEAIARLDHPNIVPIYEVGEHAGRLYFSMKLMEGGSLAERMDDIRLPSIHRKTRRDDKGMAWSSSALRRRQERIGQLMARVARAVHHAHQRGILHRDVKPANILLDAGGEPHVTDFGLARHADDDARLTQSGFIVGTPSYMAPEQARAARDLGTTADVYSVGAILYELLVGQPPFKAATPVDTLLELLDREPQRPRVRNPHVDRDLETICLKCLEKEPGRRYGSAEALAEDLERWLHRQPIVARRCSAWERVVKWARRRPAVAALTALLVLLTVSGLALVGWQWRRAETALVDVEHELYLNRVALADHTWSANDVKRAETLLDECPKHLRHWEWDFLKRRCHPERLLLQRARRMARCLAYSPDGQRLAGADYEGTIFVWDAMSGELVGAFPGPEAGDLDLAFSAEGQRIARVTSSGEMHVWSAATWERRESVPLGGARIEYAAFSGDGERVAATRDDGSIRVWDSATAKELFAATLQGQVIASMALSPDGNRVAFVPLQGSGKEDRTGEIRIWDLPSGREIPLVGQRRRVVAGLAFSRDGNQIAAACQSRDNRLEESGEICVIDLRTGKEIFRRQDRLPNLIWVAFDSTGRRIAASGEDKTIRVWEIDTGLETLTLRLPETVPYLKFSPSGTRLAAVGMRSGVRVLDTSGDPSVRSLLLPSIWRMLARLVAQASRLWRTGVSPVLCQALPRLDSISEDRAAVCAVTASPDGSLIGAGRSDGTLELWNSQTAQRVRVCPGHQKHIVSAAFSPDGREIATASRDGTVRVWDVTTGDQRLCLHGHTGIVNSVAWSPDGQSLATAGDDQLVLLWDAASGEQQRALRGHTDKVFCVAWTPDSQRVASGGKDATVRLWEVRDGSTVRVFGRHEDEVITVAFSPPDGRLLAAGTCNLEPLVRLWDTATGKPLHVLRGHTLKLTSLAFSPDGKRLASASDDKTLRLWDPLRGQEVLTLTGHTGGTTGVTFSPCGQHLISSSWDRTVRIWDGTPLKE